MMFGLQIAVCSIFPETLLMKTAARIYEGDCEIAEDALRDCRTLGKAGLLRAMRTLWRLDLRNDLSSVSAPTLIMCGAKDRVNIPAARKIATLIPQAKLHIEPNVGHLWNIENPKRFNSVLADNLAGPQAFSR
jgi:pimeloyl-ACP methyl ester carboxylesterase